jgi:hypothetical protein
LGAARDAIFEGKLGYDEFARVATITYPTPAGAAPFVITHDFDPFGNVIKVRDAATDYWTLADVDNAGRFGALTLATFGYDGDQKQIRKTTPDKDTLYFDDLYERVTAKQGARRRSTVISSTRPSG